MSASQKWKPPQIVPSMIVFQCRNQKCWKYLCVFMCLKLNKIILCLDFFLMMFHLNGVKRRVPLNSRCFLLNAYVLCIHKYDNAVFLLNSIESLDQKKPKHLIMFSRQCFIQRTYFIFISYCFRRHCTELIKSVFHRDPKITEKPVLHEIKIPSD